MKNTIKFITYSVLCAGLALAQRTAPDPAVMVQRQVERLTQTLTLNSAQQAQATTIFTSAQTANQSVMASLRDARTALTAAIKANDAGAIATASNTIGTLTGQMTANTAKADAAFYATLTADQQAKFTPGGGGFGAGFGGPGARGPRGRGGSPQQ